MMYDEARVGGAPPSIFKYSYSGFVFEFGFRDSVPTRTEQHRTRQGWPTFVAMSLGLTEG